MAAHIPEDGWLTEVEVQLRQGRNHQIRRLCKRAGLRLLHLRRISVGPIALGRMVPGEVRAISQPAGQSVRRSVGQSVGR